MLLKLQSEAGNNNIKTLEWKKNDPFFKFCSIGKFKKLGNKILTTLTIVLVEPTEVITNIEDRLKLMRIYHNDPLSGGHCGVKKLYAKLRTKFYWKNMTKDIACFVRNCEKCLLNKPKSGHKEYLTETPRKAFDIVIMDTIGPLPISELGNKFALTLMCDLTKYLVTIAIPDKSAKTVAKAIFESFVLIYGVMNTIRTDQGTEFKNEVIKELCTLLKITHNFSTPYHHETVGTIERNHRVFNEYLRAYLDETSSDWDVYLKFFTFYHNTTSNTVFDNKFTPFELIFGKNAILPVELGKTVIDPLYNVDDYAKEVKFRLQKSHLMAKELVEKHKIKQKHFYDKNSNPLVLKKGDLVLVQKEPYDKHKNIYDGPFVVISIDNVNVKIFDDKKDKVI